MKILVTGAAGAIGSHLAERLLSLGHTVVGIDALTPYYSPDIKRINARDVGEKGCKIFYRNLVSDSIDDIVKDVEIVFHCAAQPGISATVTFEEYLNNNVVATHRLLEAVKKLPTLKAFVHASTSSVYGARAGGDETTEPRPTSFYGVTKLAAEQLAMSYYREYGMPVVVCRFFSVYGERERPDKLYHKLIKAIYEDKEFPRFEGSEHHVRSYTYISDIIDGCMLIMENLHKAVGEIFNLGNDKTMTTGEGIALIEKIIGKKGKYIILPRRAGDQVETSANIGKMKSFFGYKPKVALEQGLEAQVKWFREKIYKKV